MAIRLVEEYPNRVGAPTAEYPHGVPRNKSTPTATDGTPFEQSWFRDQEGFFQGLLETAGITPSGISDTVEQSDYLDALTQISNGVTDIDVGGAADVTISVYQGRISALRLAGTLSGDIDLIVPDVSRLYWIVDDTAGDFSVTAKTEMGTGVVLSSGMSVLRCDGTDVFRADAVTTATGEQTVTEALDQRVIYVDTIADLQALPTSELVDGQVAYVRGRGEYYYSVAQGQWIGDVPSGVGASFAYTQMGQVINSNDSASPVNDNAAMWPHATVDYDADLDKFVVFYNVNAGHSINQCSVLMAKKPVEGSFETPTIVASDVNTTSYKVQAAGIAPNGDYVALLGVFNWSGSLLRSEIHRSTDKGGTWTRTVMQDAATGENIVAYNGDVTGFLKLSSGRILTLAVEPGSMLTRIYYSDDNAATWSKASITGDPTHVTEPAWAELPNGTIICMARAGVAIGSVDDKIPAKFMTSTDDGLTWTAPADSTSITEMTLANGHMLVFEDEGFIEFIFHSRYQQPDGYASLYVSRASFADAENDQFSQPQRIGKLAPQNKSIDGGTGDAGYVGAAVSPSGVINAFYYTGTFSASQISQLIGRKVVTEEREFFIDYNTGAKADGESYITELYKSGEQNEDLFIPMVNGYRAGSSTIFMRDRDIYLQISGTGGRAGVRPDGGIHLTDIDTLYCHYQGVASTGDADFGIFLYDKANPTSAVDGRVAFSVGNLEGWETVTLDVSQYTGVYYPQLSLNPGVSGDGTGTVRIVEFGFQSKLVKLGSPGEPPAHKGLYHRGTEMAYVSGDWVEGFMVGTASTSFNADHIFLTASGDTSQGKASVRTDLLALSDIDYIEVMFDASISNTSNSDFGLALYSSTSPDGSSTDRLAFDYITNVDSDGPMRLLLDVKAHNSGYLYVVANAASTGTGASTVEGRILSARLY